MHIAVRTADTKQHTPAQGKHSSKKVPNGTKGNSIVSITLSHKLPLASQQLYYGNGDLGDLERQEVPAHYKCCVVSAWV